MPLALSVPANVYLTIGKAAANMVRSSVFEAKKIASNKVEITVTPKPGTSEKPYQCENRMGIFEAVPGLFNYKLPSIDHTECIFNGGKCCRYIITWSGLRSALWKRIRNYAIFSLSAVCLSLYLFAPTTAWAVFLFLSLLTAFFFTVHAANIERDELSVAIDNLRASTDSLFEKINMNYNNVLLINEIGIALSGQMGVKDILARVVHALEKRLDYDRGMLFLQNEDRSALRLSADFGFPEEQLATLERISFHLGRPQSKGVLVVCFREQRPFLVNDIDDISLDLSARSLQFVRELGAKSFICCPIVYAEESIGVLAVDNLKTKRPLLQRDIDLLMGITPQIGVGIHNAMVTEAKEKQFHSILQVLVSSIDARDPMTAGHSVRVTTFAVGIAGEMGLSKDYCEMIRIASLLHDYGKIGISDVILKKEGKLTPEEYEEIKAHAMKTREILEMMDFDGIYKEVPQVAASHHEKLDGSGYYQGLHGEEIPLGSRILAVADVFEAITAQRHYRKPMLLEEAFKTLNENKGTHFDAMVVEAFFRYYENHRGKIG